MEDGGGGADEVHGYGGGKRERIGDAVGIGILRACGRGENITDFSDVLEVARGVRTAYTTGDAAALGKGLAKGVADEDAFRRVGGEGLGKEAVCAVAVEVVGINDGKGAVDQVAGYPDGVARAPGLFAASGRSDASGQVLKALESEGDGELVGEAGGDFGGKFLGKALPNDEDYASETRAEGVEHGVFEKGFARWADRGELFEATEAATHTSSENKEREIGHGIMR